MTKSTWLHLRFPFSFFLLPVYLFALCVASSRLHRLGPTETEINLGAALSMFVILHFLLYPASNGFNSYFDKDTDSIGGLRSPPPVTRELYYVSLLLDLAAVVWGAFINWRIALMLLIYGLVSKAYSHPAIRLKKYPLIGWFIAGLFQGGFTLLMVVASVQIDPTQLHFTTETLWGAALSTLLLWGSFPMTQVYQHDEDQKRGDLTISRQLGIRGTFVFSMTVFLMANAGFVYYFVVYRSLWFAGVFQLAMIPLMGFFIWWLLKVWKNPATADYSNTMKLNLISAGCLNLFFIWLLFQ